MTAKKKKLNKPKRKPTPVQLANRALRAYAAATKAKNRYAAIQKEAAMHLRVFGENHSDLFEDGNLQLRGGYLHQATRTVIKPCEGFSMAEFVKDFPELIDNKFKVAPMKALLSSEEGKKKLLENHCVELGQETDIEIILDKQA